MRLSVAQKSTLLLVAVTLNSCANLTEGQFQTVYVPTSDGVEAQRVYTGRSQAQDLPYDDVNNLDSNSYDLAIGSVAFNGPIAQAVSGLLRYEIHSEICLRAAGLVGDSDDEFAPVRKCFAAMPLPSECERVAGPLKKLVVLASVDRSYDIIVPTLSKLVGACRYEIRAAQGDRVTSRAESVLDVALMFAEAPSEPPNVQPNTARFVATLCQDLIGGVRGEAEVADLMLCAQTETGGALRGRQYYFDQIDLILEEGSLR